MTRPSAVALILLASIDTGCGGGGGSSLDGTWTYTVTAGGTTLTTDIAFNSDGTVSEAISGSGCKGSESIAGNSWTATSTTVASSGTSTCTGTLMCTIAGHAVSIPCATSPLGDGTCNYALSNSKNTLSISGCTSTTGTYTALGIVLTRK